MSGNKYMRYQDRLYLHRLANELEKKKEITEEEKEEIIKQLRIIVDNNHSMIMAV